MENTITITLSEYKELQIAATQNAIIKGLVKKNKYVSTDDIKVILGIEETEGSCNETV